MVVGSQPALEQHDFVNFGSGYIYIYVGSVLSIYIVYYGMETVPCCAK